MLAPYTSQLGYLLSRALRVRRLYFKHIEPLMGYPRHREHLAQLSLDVDCNLVVGLLDKLYSVVSHSRVCIVFPGSGGRRECSVIGGPESALLYSISSGRKLDFVTGDLDVSLKLIYYYPVASRVALLHVHGDNIERVKSFSGYIGPFIPTTQVEPVGCVFNLGGFTDGDRAVILAMVMDADEIVVSPITVDRVISDHKDYKLDRGKKLKVDLAIRLIVDAARELGYKPYSDEKELVIVKSRF